MKKAVEFPRSVLLTLALIVVLAGMTSHAFAATLSGQPDTLKFFKNYFVTGDYVVGGVGLRGKGDGSGYATGNIAISGVPTGATVVSAFLYWEAIEATDTASTMNGFFQGYPIVGSQPSPLTNTPPCWSSGGGTGSSNGSKHLRVYRADVAPYLVVNGQYQTNTPPNSLGYEVRLQDSGSNGAGAPLTEGASLVIIYRTLTDPLRSVVLYDGSWTMNNATSYMSQTIQWFYQATGGPAKLTHIVGDGQANFGEAENFFDGSGASPQSVQNPFNGAAGFSWDNVTFPVTVPANTSQVATSVLPNSSNIDCLSWGAVVFSTPVVDSDGDGLLDVWEDDGGYTDSKDGSWVALPGASKTIRDLFVQVDYLKNTDTATAPEHYHLPKQAALDAIGQAFANHNIVVHFDVGGAYQNVNNGMPDPFVVPAAMGAKGGNAIEEDSVACTDGTSLCDFPSQTLGIPGIVSWKTGVNYAKNLYFQHGRKDSYHYVLMGHALGLPANTWSIPDGTLQGITVTGAPTGAQTATVTTTSAHNLSTNARVTIAGAVGDFNLNGTYIVTGVPSPNSLTVSVTGVAATILNGATSANFGYFGTQASGFQNVGGVNQINEPNLVVSTGAPLSISGFSDLGGGDSVITLGLWHADDPACQADPTAALTSTKPVYCNNLVGSTTVQAGTIMHEMGHTLYLTHGGFYPALGGFGENCKSNFLSVMNYMFQIRGLPNRLATNLSPTVDYSAQTLATLDESSLNEAKGVVDPNGGLALFGTKYYGPPSYLDNLLQGVNNGNGNRFATQHCDGTPKAANETAVKIDAPTVTTNAAGALVPAAIDWNNNGVIGTVSQDINFDGFLDQVSPTTSYGLTGFNDWNNLYFQQIGARRNTGGFSADITTSDISGGGLKLLGGGLKLLGGGSDLINGGSQLMGSGLKLLGGGLKLLGGGLKLLGGGLELDFDDANSVVDPPVGVSASQTGKTQVTVRWSPPTFGQIRAYYVWRATVTKVPMSSSNPPVLLTTTPLSGSTFSYPDNTVKSNQTYQYFVTAALGADSGANAGNQSGPSNFAFITVK